MRIDRHNLFELDTDNRTRGHEYKLTAARPRLETRLHFFGYRVVAFWNHLSTETVHASLVLIFKHLLKKEDLSKFVQNHHHTDLIN